jgi:hypothetical protein
VPAREALREWVRLAVRTPNGALTKDEVESGQRADKIAEGRELF